MSTEEKTKFKRGPRVNNEQKEYLASYMVAHSDFAAGKFSGHTGAEKHAQKWIHIAEDINAKGPQKTVSQWQKVWADMKIRSRGKVTAIKNQHNKTGNFEDDTEPLTDTDKKVLSVIGSDAVEGLNSVPDSTPESVSELRKLMMGDYSPLFQKPVNPVRIFETFEIDEPVTITDIGMEQNTYTIIESCTKDINKTHLPTHCTSTSSTSTSIISTPTTYLAPALHTTIQLTRTPTTHASDTTTLSTTPHTYDTDTQTTCSPPTHAPSTHALHTDIQTHQKLNKRHVTQRKMKEDKAAKFIELQANQNKILESMSKAIMLAAETDKDRMELTKKEIEIKKEEMEIKKEEIKIKKEELELKKEALRIKRSKVEEISKCGTQLNNIWEFLQKKI